MQQSLGIGRANFLHCLESLKSQTVINANNQLAVFVNQQHTQISRVLFHGVVMVTQADIKRIETALNHINQAQESISKAQAALWSFNAIDKRNLGITGDLLGDYIAALNEIVTKAQERRAAMLAEKAAA